MTAWSPAARVRIRTGLIAVMALHAGPSAAVEAHTARRVEPRSGLELVHLPRARILLGCESRDHECFDDEKPARHVTVDGFWIGRTEVTVEAYDRCVQAGACSTDVNTPSPPAGAGSDVTAWAASCNEGKAGRGQHPINCVDWAQASRFCAWIGGRLPTASEWERTAKGTEGRIFPWGAARLSGVRANFCDRTCHLAHPEFPARADESDGWAETAPVGTFPLGASQEDILDLAGNVWEWTRTHYDARNVEIRGGGWTVDEPRWFRGSNRSWWPPSTRALDLGFRCVVGDHG